MVSQFCHTCKLSFIGGIEDRCPRCGSWNVDDVRFLMLSHVERRRGSALILSGICGSWQEFLGLLSRGASRFGDPRQRRRRTRHPRGAPMRSIPYKGGY